MSTSLMPERAAPGSFDIPSYATGNTVPTPQTQACRILAVDDEPEILADYARIFAPTPVAPAGGLQEMEELLFGAPRQQAPAEPEHRFELTCCRSGAEAVAAVQQAVAEGRPYAIAFVDVRMPPGIDGIAASAQMRVADPNLHIAIVTGYSDIRPEEASRRIPPADKLFWCQKPFRRVELLQMTVAVNAKRGLELSLVGLCGQLERQVQERTKQLSIALRKADEASRAKSNFLANMSHELRTPLNAVIGFAELLGGAHAGPLTERQREYIGDILTSGQHLLAIIEDVLDLTRIEAGKLKVEIAPVVVSEILEGVAALMQPELNRKRLLLSLRIPDAMRDAVLRTDQRRLKQILLNLMSNAVKFTPEGGSVTLGMAAAIGGVTVSVADTGIGMSRQELAQALKPFGQISNPMLNQQKGTGLGLPLVASLSNELGAHLDIRSEPGQGTEVAIAFPSAPPMRTAVF